MRHARLVLAVGVASLYGCGVDDADDEGSSASAGEVEQSVTAGVCPGPSTVQGVDVSKYQGTVNWASVRAAGKRFGIARVSDGLTYPDSYFAGNWSHMKTAGMLRGAYQFFRPGQDPVAQANMVIARVGMLGAGDLPVMLDMEVTDGQSPTTITSKIHQWVNTITAGTGKKPIIYTGAYFWDDHVKSAAFASYPLNVAWYGTNCPGMPNEWTHWVFHQYTSSGTVPGISGRVDLDVFNGTLAQLEAYAAPRPIQRGDVNGDRRADLVTAYSDGNAYVFAGAASAGLASGTTSFAGSLVDTRLAPGPGNLMIDVADVTGDGHSDLIALNTSGSVEVWPGDAGGHFGSAVSSFNGSMPLASGTSSGHDPIAVADVTGDGRADLVTAHTNGNIYVYPGQANGTFAAGVASGGGTFDFALHDGTGHWPVGVADVNGDGHADLVTLHSNGTAYVYLGGADGHLGTRVDSFAGTMQSAFADGTGHEIVGLGDVDGDGRADLVTILGGTVYVYRGTSTGAFSSGVASFAHTLVSARFTGGTGYDVAAVLDVNGDGHADLIAAHSSGKVMVWPGRADGTFGAAVSSFTGFESAWFSPHGHDIVSQSVSIRRSQCSLYGCRVSPAPPRQLVDIAPEGQVLGP